MRLGNTEAAADDDSRQGVVYTCGVLGQGGRSRKRRGIGISEDLARGWRKKCPQRGLPAWHSVCCILHISDRPSHCIARHRLSRDRARLLAATTTCRSNMPGVIMQPDNMEAADSPTSRFYIVPQERVVSIEHPCIVRNFDNGVKSLGGEPQMKHVSGGVCYAPDQQRAY